MDISMEMWRVKERVAAIRQTLPPLKFSDPISKLGAGRRVMSVMENGQVHTIGQLLGRRSSELIKWRNVGYCTLLEILTVLAKRGMYLKDDK